jgi:alpha-glucosidase
LTIGPLPAAPLARSLGEPFHDGSPTYVDNPEPALGDKVTVFLWAPAGVGQVSVRSTPDGEPRYTPAVPDRAGWWRAEVEVRNPVTRYRWQLDGRWLNALGVFGYEVPDTYDFRLVAYDPPPAWTRDAIVYEVFPDRFAKSTMDKDLPDWAIHCGWNDPVIGRGPETPRQVYGGDLDGIVQRLDHLTALGVNTLYLTPIFPARSNHRYDAAGFDRVDPLLGGDAALDRLSRAVHERGMRLVGDLTTNHCGASHPWFTAALADPDAPERDMFSIGPSGYECWLGVESLPKFNWASAELRRRFFDGPDAVVTRWLDRFDGWRVDVANMTGRLRAVDQTHEVATLMRRAVAAARPDAMLVAEHSHDATGDLDRDGWQGTMNYAGFTCPLWSWLRGDPVDGLDLQGLPRRTGPEAVATMRAFAGLVSWRAQVNSWILLGSHDTPRIHTVVDDPGRLEVAIGLLMTLPGVPMIFAGDELGLDGVNGEDARRTMPWDEPGRWDHAALARYRGLIALRRSQPALRRGSLRWVYVDDDALVFLRETREETLLVLARRCSGKPIAVPLVLENLYGGADPSTVDGVTGLAGDGPTFQVWRTP